MRSVDTGLGKKRGNETVVSNCVEVKEWSNERI